MSGARGGQAPLVVRGVGALAAETVAQAAELLAVLARQAGQDAATTRSESLHARASALAVSNEMAFTRASRQLEAGQSGDVAPARAPAEAVDVLMRICQAAGDLVTLAAELASGSLSQRSADLAGIAELAAGACGAAALLVRANSFIDADDPRRKAAAELAEATSATARRIAQSA